MNFFNCLRLSELQKTAIRSAIYECDPNAKIYVYGSRADDSKKGGDIDLFVLSEQISQSSLWKIKDSICEKIGEQRIDLFVEKDTSKPFTRIAMGTGVAL